MGTVRALVITGFGINCEEETAAAYRLAGADAEFVHLNSVLHGRCAIGEYDVLNLPGGFSFGDDLGAGKVLANKMRYGKLASGRSLLEELDTFLARGGFILGICNGFQALVKMGLLPNVGKGCEQEVSLVANDSGSFEDRWCDLVVNPASSTPFLDGMSRLSFPVRHKEGKLVIRSPELRERILGGSLNCLSYCDRQGRLTGEYPANPNGSELHCAALCDASGQILGIMPHPEAFLSAYNHPAWGRRLRTEPDASEEGDGLRIFQNIVKHVEATR